MFEVTCYDSNGNSINHFTQWDSGQVIYFKDLDLSTAPTIHFHNKMLNKNEAVTVVSTVKGNGDIVVDVPNFLLQKAYPIYVYIYVEDKKANSGTTAYITNIPVQSKAKPSDYKYVENISSLSLAMFKEELKVDLENYIRENAVPIHNLTETEFWDKYNAGELRTAFYTYETDNVVIKDFSDAVIDVKAPIIEYEDKAFVVKNYFGTNSLTMIDKDGNILGDYNLKDMLPSEDSPLDFVIPYYEMSKAFIGIDDTGYIYMNVRKTIGNEYSYGVVSANIADIGNSQSWHFVEGINSTVAFAPFNCCLPELAKPDMTKPDYLKIDDGGIFCFEWDYQISSANFEGMLGNFLGSNSGRYGVRGSVYYLKNGQIIPWDSLNYPRMFFGGSRCFAVDKENNCLYTTNIYTTAFGVGDDQISIKKISIDGTTKDYFIRVGDDLKEFETASSVMGSFIYYKNNKVFMYINNSVQSMLVLDLESETYSSINQFTLHENGYSSRQPYLTSLYDSGNSISFITTTKQVNETRLCSWNYNEDNIYVTQLQTVTTYMSLYDIKNSLNIDLDGNIVFVQKNYVDNSYCLAKIDSNNHNTWYSDPIPSYVLDSSSETFDNYVFEKDKIIGFTLSYTFQKQIDGYIIVIDKNGNVTTTSQQILDDTIHFNENYPTFALDENICAISSSVYYDKKNMVIKKINQCQEIEDSYGGFDCLALFDKMLLSKNGDTNGKQYAFLKDGTKTVTLLSMNNKIALKEEG